MRTFGSWLMRLVALGMMAAMWFVSPYMLHSTSHVLNVVQLLGWGFGLLMVTLLTVGSFALRKPIRLPNPPQRPAMPPSVNTAPLCEQCAKYTATVFGDISRLLLCGSCAASKPGAHGTLYPAHMGLQLRSKLTHNVVAEASNPAK